MEWQLDVVLFHEHTKAESLVHKGNDKGNDEAMPLSAKSLIESLAVSMETGVLS